MAERNCCRFHHWLVGLLVLSALALLSHYIVADIVLLSSEEGAAYSFTQTARGISIEEKESHPTGLHNTFLIIPFVLLTLAVWWLKIGDISDPVGPGWRPPALLPPPITR